MKEVEILYSLLAKEVESLNSKLNKTLALNQQDKVKKHISLSGANGRLWVSPSTGGYDVSISGASLERTLLPVLTAHFKRRPDGYKQKNSNKGFLRQPYWRTNNFGDVQYACELYANTSG
ncbi:histidine kinase [Vibrio parahaemolyticus]|uniref:histidine kinase n=1 Tax=Vibrio parahaemolyticus TaxID=670 RepID=UPI00084A7E7D|nr:histidine kinase [Vibrio parahaemolyticus]ELA7884164.1 histidine kinase [Vibrio parahaemolyticus]ELA9307028.1 histidine kinase [Vibrio parahaemolyticus]ODX21492.1 histidine kinase [Vibrio parahaemolyticus]ODX92626.1 histidine kinase [Vibrio parahaemolyticus]ODY09048.1 histidine kinase [Vibrio parahaemolyticus]